MEEKITIDQCKNPIYKHIFSNVQWLRDIVEQTLWREILSENSFQLKGDDKLNIICNTFNIDITQQQYDEAISGEGNEGNRITTLHSSSLAALLFFHDVKNNPLKLIINNEEYIFDDVHFEMQTVVKGEHKSNMDVVLIGRSKHYKQVVLFLECKFIEYLSSGKYSNISYDVYHDVYEKLGLFNKETLKEMYAETSTDEKRKQSITLNYKSRYQYCAGIKQMISHYKGIKNFIKGGFKFVEKKGLKDVIVHPDKVLLAEILFDLGEIDTHKKLAKYETAYKELSKAINKHNKNDIFEMVTESFTYQDVFKDYPLNERIKEFYQL